MPKRAQDLSGPAARALGPDRDADAPLAEIEADAGDDADAAVEAQSHHPASSSPPGGLGSSVWAAEPGADLGANPRNLVLAHAGALGDLGHQGGEVVALMLGALGCRLKRLGHGFHLLKVGRELAAGAAGADDLGPGSPSFLRWSR
jgi:hypothetical protein